MNATHRRHPERRRRGRPWWNGCARAGTAAGSTSTSAPGPAAGFDPVTRLWCDAARQDGTLVPLPPLAGEVVLAGDCAAGHAGHSVARLRPGRVQDIVRMMRFAHRHDIRMASTLDPTEAMDGVGTWLLVEQQPPRTP